MKRQIVACRYWGNTNGNLAEIFTDRVMEQQVDYGYQVPDRVTNIDRFKRKHQHSNTENVEGHIERPTERSVNLDSLLQFEQGELEAKLRVHGCSSKEISLLKKCLTHYKYNATCLAAFETTAEIEANNYNYYNYCRGKADAYKNVILSLLYKEYQNFF